MNTWAVHQHFNESRKKDTKNRGRMYIYPEADRQWK